MLLVFTILTADIGVLIYGAEFNDRACRDLLGHSQGTRVVAEGDRPSRRFQRHHRRRLPAAAGTPPAGSGRSPDARRETDRLDDEVPVR